jgi:hypothetical protein
MCQTKGQRAGYDITVPAWTWNTKVIWGAGLLAPFIPRPVTLFLCHAWTKEASVPCAPVFWSPHILLHVRERERERRRRSKMTMMGARWIGVLAWDGMLPLCVCLWLYFLHSSLHWQPLHDCMHLDSWRHRHRHACRERSSIQIGNKIYKYIYLYPYACAIISAGMKER